ncbi:hypothetical protein BH10BAC3_BH10BAC3_40750 [soil metagenome]
MNHSIQFSIVLSATSTEVMELLTNPVLIEAWGGGVSIVEKKVGGQFEMFDGWVSGKILKITGNELAYNWKTTEWNEAIPASEVYYRLQPVEDGTEVFVNHIGLPSKKEADSHRTGWNEYFFDPIKKFIANQKAS